MEKEDEINRKKDLLQKEIVDKNYDKTQFINFCLSKKENGDDLNEYTYEELSSFVKEFVSSQQSSLKEDKKEDDKMKTENIEKKEEILKAKENKESKNLVTKTIKCKKLVPTELNGKEIKVIVSNPTVVEGGMFGKSYIKFTVTTQPFEWKVERKYTDFDTLRKLIQKFYPGFYVPPLPLKKAGNKKFTESFIQKRMALLNQFINSVVKNESFKSFEFLHTFLSYNDRKKFDSKFKEYQTTTLSPYIEEYKTLDGIISISLDEKNEEYFKTINKYFNSQENILDKLNNNLKNLNQNMIIISQLVEEIKKNFDEVQTLNSTSKMNPTITKAYEEISGFFKNWGNILSKQRFLVKGHIKDFFKFVNLEGKAYSELIVKREELNQKYKNENTRITSKKEKLFNAGDINKMEINTKDKSIDKQRLLKDKPYAFDNICFADSRELEKLYNHLGYANNMNMTELNKIHDEYCLRIINNIVAFAKGFHQTTNDMMNYLSSIENISKDVNKGNKS